MNALERDKVLTVRLTAEERDMLRAISERSGLSASDWVRLTIRATYESASKETPRPPSR